MYRHHHLRRTGLALAAPLASLALLITPALAGAGVAEAKAASCSSWTTGSPPSPGSFDNLLRAVTALSACNVWAVGDYANNAGQRLTLAEHWNGTSWAVQSTPNVALDPFDYLFGIACTSATGCMAVGEAQSDSGNTTLTLAERRT